MDQELPFIQKTKRVIENPADTFGANMGSSFKSKLKTGLEQQCWKLNRRATFLANLPFGGTYLIFDSTPELDADERYRLRMVMGNSSVLDYRIMKWIYVETPAGSFELKFIDLLTNRFFLIFVLLAVVVLFVLAFVFALDVFGQPAE